MKRFISSEEPHRSTGSPPKGEPVYLVVGKLHRPHGIRGEMLMEMITDFPERIRPGISIYIGSEHLEVKVAGCRSHSKGMLISLVGYHTPEEVERFRNQFVYVRSSDRPKLPPGEYYHHEILGLTVEDEQGIVLGVVREILETGANDVYVVQPPHGREILIPAISTVVLDIDLERGKMKVRLIPGLVP